MHLSWREASIRPGTRVRLEGQAGVWKVERWILDRMVVTLQLAGMPSGPLPPAAASAGRPIGHFDQPIGPTTLALFDLPSLMDEIADRPRLFAMAAGAGAAWRRAELEVTKYGDFAMSDGTPRFGLPFILPGQAQKELYHNEALAQVDSLLHSAVEGPPLAQSPAQPQEGQCWIAAAGAEGAWSGKDHHLAAWTAGGWRFIAPRPGMCLWNKAGGYWVHWRGASWSDGELLGSRVQVNGQQVVGERQPAILNPSGGTTIDAEARAALAQVIATLMSHGLIG